MLQKANWTAAGNPVRPLVEDYSRADPPPDTGTTMWTMQGTPGEGTSSAEGPALRFLHRLLRETPDLEREMMKLQQKVVGEQGAIEEGIRLKREEENLWIKQRG